MGVDKLGYAYAAAVAAGGYLANNKTLGKFDQFHPPAYQIRVSSFSD